MDSGFLYFLDYLSEDQIRIFDSDNIICAANWAVDSLVSPFSFQWKIRRDTSQEPVWKITKRLLPMRAGLKINENTLPISATQRMCVVHIPTLTQTYSDAHTEQGGEYTSIKGKDKFWAPTVVQGLAFSLSPICYLNGCFFIVILYRTTRYFVNCYRRLPWTRVCFLYSVFSSTQAGRRKTYCLK